MTYKKKQKTVEARRLPTMVEIDEEIARPGFEGSWADAVVNLYWNIAQWCDCSLGIERPNAVNCHAEPVPYLNYGSGNRAYPGCWVVKQDHGTWSFFTEEEFNERYEVSE